MKKETLYVRAALLCVLPLLLCQCAPRTIYKTEPVKIAVPVSCAPTVPPEPVWQVPLAANGTHAQKAKAIVTDLSASHGYIGVLEAALSACK